MATKGAFDEEGGRGMVWWIPFLLVFGTSLITAMLVTPLARLVAWRVESVDQPGGRRINCRPLPRMGGIAIFCALLASMALQSIGYRRLGWPVTAPSQSQTDLINYPRVVLSFCLIFLTGILDDKFELSPRQKLLGQILAASVAVSGGPLIDVVVNPLTDDGILLGWLGYPITVCYLVAYANIFNLIDGMDGLASGIACIASSTMWIVSTMAGHLDAAMLAITLAGATLGFLRYNFNPASIILGDSGALLIGFALGTVSLLSVQRVAGLTSIIVPLVISGIPIIDTFSAIVRRGRAHVSIGQADKGHIHHRLMGEGFNQRQTVLFIYLWTGLLSIGSIVMTQVRVVPRIVIFCMLIVASVLFAMRLHLFRPVLLHHFDPVTGTDELVGPQDDAFEEAAEQFEEEHPLFPRTGE